LMRAPSARFDRKAQVPLPGWGDTLVGDDDTDVTFTPQGQFRTTEIEAALADPVANMKELAEGIKQGHWVSTDMEQRGGYSGALSIKAGTKGTVKISVKAHWFFDQKINDEYDQEFSCSWDVSADRTGKLKIGTARPEWTPMGADAPFQLGGLNPSQDETSVQIAPLWQSFQNTDVPNISVGVDVGGGKSPVSGGGGLTLGNERTSPAGTLSRPFDLKLTVTDIPEPEGTVTIGPITMRTHKVHEVLFEKPRQDSVSRKQEGALYTWFTELSPETRALLREGTEKVKLDGYASSTDKAPNNRELARRRVESVKKILRDFGPKEFDDAALGEYEEGVGEPEGEVETQAGRKVVIDILEAPVTIFEGEEPPAGP
ncbi:MAG: hypothetical protein ACRDLN_17995, partial [Solirubrobacteraceae bacterium]